MQAALQSLLSQCLYSYCPEDVCDLVPRLSQFHSSDSSSTLPPAEACIFNHPLHLLSSSQPCPVAVFHVMMHASPK